MSSPDHRKIMSLGNTSNVISLPRKWLEINGLKRGSLVNVDIQKDGSLLVSSIKEHSDKICVIQLVVGPNETGDSITRKIVSCFLDGYSTITLVSKVFSVEQQRAIRQIVSILYMMVIESEAGRVVLQSLVDDSKTSIISCIERMHIITSSMCRDLLRAVAEGKPELAKSVVSIEGDVDQLAFLVFRLIRVASVNPAIANKLEIDALGFLDYQTLGHRVERIADDIEMIAINLAKMLDSHEENQVSIPKTLLSLATNVFQNYNIAVNSFFSRDLSSVNEVVEYEKGVDKIIEDFYTEIGKLNHNREVEDRFFISKIVIAESLRKIAHYSSDIAELTMDWAYKPGKDKEKSVY
ncbi:MAG: hypothetical protein NTV15_00910 [Candidatus Bathyarchaeota archaeon]|nr:hypothetical protein [Candidatus Bathyarchaeota archaeon]